MENKEFVDELKARPIGSVKSRLTPAQLSLRRRISMAYQAGGLEEQPPTPEAARIYQENPMGAFYMTKSEPPQAKRAFGVAQSNVGSDRLCTITAMVAFNNVTLGGTAVSDLQPVDDWPDDIYERFETGFYQQPEIFLDPLGWVIQAVNS